mmetsp:Transcript_12735/g.16624  ORF Transcript_12735/g.16624 Transcript_12735/m.16624 type:complete len:343 (+) Transcript_12735:72-1100(+)
MKRFFLRRRILVPLLGISVVSNLLLAQNRINNWHTRLSTVYEAFNPVNRSVAVFYNLFVSSIEDKARVLGMMQEQFALLNPAVHIVFIRSIGVAVNVSEKFPHAYSIRHDKEGGEKETLQMLWQYCRDHPEKQVAYLHSKGSFHSKPSNEKLRWVLTRSVLSNQCARMSDESCDVCSARFSPVPHPHSPGNMWLAECSYIRHLIDPIEFEEKMSSITFSEYTMQYFETRRSDSCLGLNRYSQEHWVHSHPSVRPCDLLTDERFLWGYKGIPAGEFEMHLQPAPRLQLQSYYLRNHFCGNAGLVKEDRLIEYEALFGKNVVQDSWWGHKVNWNTTITDLVQSS